MNEHARDPVGNDGVVGATFTPDHWAPMTWYRCTVVSCETRVDPWDHNTRCPAHRPPADETGDVTRARRREVARAIVEAERERVAVRR